MILNAAGRQDRPSSPWCSLDIKDQEWPRVLEMGNRLAFKISTLGAVAVLVALRAYVAEVSSSHSSGVHVVPTWTGNSGNGAALHKLMTNGLPASTVIVDFAA